MKKCDHRCLRLVIVLFNILFSTQVFAADAFRLYESGRTDFDLGIDYYKTDSNFSSNGSRQNLVSGNYLAALNIEAQGRYVLNPELGLLAGLQLTNSESSDLNFDRKNSSLSYLHLGMDYLVRKESGFLMFSEVLLSYPFEKVDVATDSVLNSDGAIEFKPRMTAVFFKRGYSPYATVGLNYRTEGLATLVTYVAGVELEFERLGFGGNVNGFFTLLGDQKKESERSLVNNKVNAGSLKYNSYNPGLFATDIYLKYYLDRDFIIKANLGYQLIGYNTSAGLNLGFGISWGFGEANSVYSKPIQPQPIPQPTQQPVMSQPITTPLPAKTVPSPTPKPITPPQNKTSSGPEPKAAKQPEPQTVYKPLPKPSPQPKPKPIPVPPVVKLPKSKPAHSDTSYIKQIEGSPKSLEKATEPEPPANDSTPPEYEIKLKKVKKSKKKNSL